MRYVIKEKLLQFVREANITDEAGQPIYHVDHVLISLQPKVILRDLAGHEVASVERKLLAMRPTYEITRGGEELAAVRQHFFTPFGDRFTIDIPGPDDLELQGNFLEHEFTISRGSTVVATISKRWLSLADTYAMETASGQDDALLLAAVLALDLAEDSERH